MRRPERAGAGASGSLADIYSLACSPTRCSRALRWPPEASRRTFPRSKAPTLIVLAAVFAKALAEKAAARFETAREFADALERALTPLAATSPTDASGAAPKPRRPDLELPLDIDLETPPLSDSTGPHVEISAIDAVLPSSADDPNVADLRLHQSRPGSDLSTLDTRFETRKPRRRRTRNSTRLNRRADAPSAGKPSSQSTHSMLPPSAWRRPAMHSPTTEA